jgi:predicted LPLAT superfamily acyltransferase
MSENALVQEWTVRPERGSLVVVKFGVWLALRLGRRLARLLLYPVCLYFLVSSGRSARHSRGYLARVLDHRPGLADIFAHYLTFASCLLDRVFLLNEQNEQFEIRVHGEEIMRDIERRGGGCMLFGAHFGSFEVTRAVGRQRTDLPISLLMYEENAKKIRAALAAVNPRIAAEVIGLGRFDSLMAVADRLKRGHFIGVLADRNFDGKDLVRYPFLGAPASFPRGPFRVATLMRCPVVMMFGIYRGGRTYDVHFELLTDGADARAQDADARIAGMMQRYVASLELHCRQAPLNWFNFFDFWA